jgi:hypothetical protein
MKKFMIIALLAIGFIVLTAPESNAGVSIGIGVGFPVYGYPAYYPYGYGYYRYSYYPYGAPYYRPVIYYSSVYGLIIGGIGCTFGGATSGIKRLTTFVNTV